MSKKVAITGHTKGLGKYIAEMFDYSNWNVTGFSRTNGYNIETDYETIADTIKGYDLFVNNAYADGYQLDLLELTYGRVENIIVMGSVASDWPDPAMPIYSEHKRQLEHRCRELANEGKSNILLLKLTGRSYTNDYLIKKTINFWLEHKSFCEITYTV